MKIVVLDNIRSVYNVGSIFRTCNAVGVEKIYLCGITPTPLDKKGRKRKDFSKVALGSEAIVKWGYKENIKDLVKELKKEGYYIISLEQDKNAVDYKSVKAKSRTAFIIGNEVDGINKEILKNSDVVVEIPMKGTKESLNVTIAFGIALYRILGL